MHAYVVKKLFDFISVASANNKFGLFYNPDFSFVNILVWE